MANINPKNFPAVSSILDTSLVPVYQGGWRTATSKVLTSKSVTVVDTIADLRLEQPVNGGIKLVKGYYAPGDGGGGPERIGVTGAAAGTYVDDGGSVIVPAGGDGSAAFTILKRSGEYYLDDYGGLPGGATDCSDAISRILARIALSGGQGKIKAGQIGKYQFGSGFVLPPYIDFEGLTRFGTEINFAENTNGVQVRRGCKVSNLKVTGSTNQTAGKWLIGFGFYDTLMGGLAHDNAWASLVNIEIGDDINAIDTMADGLVGSNSFLCNIDHVRVARCNRGAFFNHALNAATFTNCEFVRNNWGFIAESLNGVKFNQVTCEGNKRVGMILALVKSASLDTMYFESNHTSSDADASARTDLIIGGGSPVNVECVAAGITSTDPGGGVSIPTIYCSNYGANSDTAIMINRQRNCHIGDIFATGYGASEYALKVTDDAYNTGYYTDVFSNPVSLVSIGASATGFSQLKSGEFAHLTRYLTGSVPAAGGVSAAFGTFENGSTYEVVANQSGGASGVTCKAHVFVSASGVISVTNLVSTLCQIGASGSQLTVKNNHTTNAMAFRIQWGRLGYL